MARPPEGSTGAWAVELAAVTKKFGDFVAVDSASLSIEDGEFFSLLGPSGCGKTTTLRMIAGFEEPTTGQIFIGGQLIANIPPYRRPVNTVFQNYALFPHMTVEQNMAFGLEMAKVPRLEIERRVHEALQLVRLPGLVQQVGRPKEIYEHPANRFVADFIGETNFLEGTVAELGTPAKIAIGDYTVLGVTDGRPVEPGQRVTLAIRPEKINLYPKKGVNLEKTWFSAEEFAQLAGAPLQPGVLDADRQSDRDVNVVVGGLVDEAIYIGTDTRYLVRLAEGVWIVVRMQNLGTRYDATFEVGNDVFVHWLADNAQVLIE